MVRWCVVHPGQPWCALLTRHVGQTPCHAHRLTPLACRNFGGGKKEDGKGTLKSQVDIKTKHTLIRGRCYCLSLVGSRLATPPISTMYSWFPRMCSCAPRSSRTPSCARTLDCARRFATLLCLLGCAFPVTVVTLCPRAWNHSGSLSRKAASTTCWPFAIPAALIGAFPPWVTPYTIAAVPRWRVVEIRYTHASLKAAAADATANPARTICGFFLWIFASLAQMNMITKKLTWTFMSLNTIWTLRSRCWYSRCLVLFGN